MSVRSVAKSTKSQVSHKSAITTKSMIKQREEEAKLADEKQKEADLAAIRAKYVPLIDQTPKKYHPKMVGLNPNMRPTANQSQSKIFPMSGLWSSKQLLKSTRDTYVVPVEEQQQECKLRDKKHFKIMYEQKEYMEEYLKFKDVIANMKK